MFQLLSTVHPVSFQQGAVYETLITFLQYDDEKVGTLTTVFLKTPAFCQPSVFYWVEY